MTLEASSRYRRRLRLTGIGVGLAGAALLLALWLSAPRPARPPGPELAKLREAELRFPAEPARPLAFPADYGAHPEAAAETWEVVGWVEDRDARGFAFRLSFARLGLTPNPPRRPSAWATAAAYRALFTLTELDAGRFRARERYQRAALGLSGADRTRVWVDQWSLQLHPAAFALRGREGDAALALELRPSKPPLIADAAQPFRAYFHSRLAVSGTLAAGPERPVTGSAWLTRAWGRLLPPAGAVALDRIQLQLDDGRELLATQLRRRDGSAPPVASGLLVDSQGRVEGLGRDELTLQPTRYWTSPATRVRYPIRWTLRLPARGIELRLSAPVEDQEVQGELRAWSGTVQVTGNDATQRPLSGVGFVESPGY
ncbi:lipocalin family protein [Candidatus Methylocalor cossyra]|uniref:Secreted hydrolase n=1 Tax=Candidatus Methylocalor cossyra TaxID=3108543 RepID=A0ABP1C6L9_9GAMM